MNLIINYRLLILFVSRQQNLISINGFISTLFNVHVFIVFG